jgi:hypothetical protein
VARIFLCHASEDKAQVREVYQQLKALGFVPWLDVMDILPGQDWDYVIERALETADFVLVFLSTRSVEKVGYVQREFRRALYHAEQRPEGFIHTIPVKLDDCVVPRRFRRHQWANLYENGAFERIVRALHYGLQQRGEPLPEPLTRDPSSGQLETTIPPLDKIVDAQGPSGDKDVNELRKIDALEVAPVVEDMVNRKITSSTIGSEVEEVAQLGNWTEDTRGYDSLTSATHAGRSIRVSAWTATRITGLILSLLQGAKLILVSTRAPYIHRYLPAPPEDSEDTAGAVRKKGMDFGWVHRVPSQVFRLFQSDNGVRWSRPAGGLISALDPAMQACHGTWVAWGSGSADRETVNAQDHVQVPPDNPQSIVSGTNLAEGALGNRAIR